MENMNARTNEIEEITTVDEVEETSENSAAGSLFAGAIGGFLAYGIIVGVQKLRWAIKQRKAQKEAEAADNAGEVINATPVKTQEKDS